jgi:hypothetical protein
MLTGTGTGWSGALLSQPAAWSVPFGFVVMIGVSLLTPAASRPTSRARWCACTPPSPSPSTVAAGGREEPEPRGR